MTLDEKINAAYPRTIKAIDESFGREELRKLCRAQLMEFMKGDNVMFLDHLFASLGSTAPFIKEGKGDALDALQTLFLEEHRSATRT